MKKETFDYLETVAFSATVCDCEGIVLYQNAVARANDGDVIGKNLYDCHQPKTAMMIKQMIQSGSPNTYEIIRNGKRRFVHQTPWYSGESGAVAGLIEIAINVPAVYPVHNRDLQPTREKPQVQSGLTDFAAIDFETANNEPTSVCSVGIVIVRDGKIVDNFYSLIKPEPNYYNFYCTQVHGLTHTDTCYAPPFPEVWKQVVPLLTLNDEDAKRLGRTTLPLVAHNKAFDEKCLKAVFRCYQMDYPDYEFHCTLMKARKVWTQGRHNLNIIAERCGYVLENHHHALADAEACAAIAIKLFDPNKSYDYMEVKEKVYEVMLRANMPVKADKLMELSGMERCDIDRAIRALKAEGYITSPKRGHWQPAR